MARTLQLTVAVPAPPAVVFDAMTDWRRQGEWMLATRVEPGDRGGRGEGATISAWTGVGRVGFWDPMRISAWREPHEVGVEHLGRIVRGTGEFRVEPDGSGSRFVWREVVEVPGGRVGAVGWLVVRRVLAAAVGFSLRRFARFAAARPSKAP